MKKVSDKKIKFTRKENIQYKITALKSLVYMYRKERRRAHLDKLIVCPLKLHVTKNL